MSTAARNRAALVLSALAVLSAAVAVQAFAEVWNRRLDLTPEHRLSLSPWTLGVLGEVDRPLRIELWHRRGERQRSLDLLELMRDHCPELSWELVDLDRNPQRAKDRGVDHYDRAVLSYDGRDLVVPAGSEEVLTGAIAKLVRRTPRVVSFVTGHRERGLTHGKDEDYGRAAGLLRDEGFEVRTLPLLGEPGVPADASAVVVAGPEVDFVPGELAKLGSYLDGGGSVLLLVDPVELPALADWLAGRGLRLRDDVVVDGSNRVYGSDGTSVVVPFWREHEATAALDVPAVLGRARSVALASGREEETETGSSVLARTARESFAAAGAARTRAGQVTYEEGRDEQGPVPVMAVAFSAAPAAAGARAGRLVVVGDADFPSDAFLPLLGNKDLFLHLVGWLADDRAGAARPPAQTVSLGPLSPVFVSERHLRWILAATTFVEPLLVLAAGVAVVVARRRRS